jgi:diaminopimelate epimerase
LRFAKWHGLGNDYLLVERDEVGVPLEADLVRRLCGYHFGVGSDGILEVVVTDGPRAEIVIWNPDGSTAELSGNGTRIAARWLARRAGADEVAITVGEREVHARMHGGLEVEMDMGPVEVAPTEALDVNGTQLEFTPVSVGNPHAVIARDPAKSFCGSARSSRTTRAFPSGQMCSSSASTRARTRLRASGSEERGRHSPRARAPARSPAPRS